jgi:hypothetical protein
MTATASIGCFIFTTCSFLRCTRALRGSCGRFFGRFFVAAIGAYSLVVNFAGTAIGFTSIACKAKQLYV